jgi:hypothetical protein
MTRLPGYYGAVSPFLEEVFNFGTGLTFQHVKANFNHGTSSRVELARYEHILTHGIFGQNASASPFKLIGSLECV